MNIRDCLDRLDEAIAAGRALGLDVDEATRVRDTARARLAFPSDAYVLALAGGTGVGKSTLLNALAGEEVSASSARRPTTADGVAWIPAAKRGELSEILGWLDVRDVREHAGGVLPGVAIVDLPDVDSVRREHRERVDALLPRVDAVAWVVDPEKYKDELLHGTYLREWAPRLRRQIVVLNRADLLAPADAVRVRDDLRAQLKREGLNGMPVIITSARAGSDGVAQLRTWLAANVDAKRVIAERAAAATREAVATLAESVGVERGETAPLVDRERRERALEDAGHGVLALIDMRTLRRQAVAATRLAARPRGAGPFGHVTSAIYRLTGRARASADPAGHLRRWRLRGSLAPAVEPLRELVATAVPAAPPRLRASLAALSAPGALEGRLADAVDRAVVAEAGDLHPPTSAVWSLIGIAQYAVTAVLLFTALWFAALFVVHDVPTGVLVVPYLGPIPTPVVVLAGALLAGYLLAVLLRLHAGWLGSRWASRIGDRVTAAVRQHVRDGLLVPLESIEATRAQLVRAARGIAESCR